MAELLSIGSKAKSIDAVNVLKRVLNEQNTKEFFITLNTRDQLFDKGEDRDGVKIRGNSAGYLEGGEYSPNTIQGVEGQYQGKIEKNLPTDRITFFDTGDFYKSFRVEVNLPYYEITADDLKGGQRLTNLIQNGVKILGLNDENKRKFENYLLERTLHLTLQALFA